MPKMTVYLPDDLFKAVKKRGLPVSELLQDAIRRELVLEKKAAGADRLARELIEEYGEPSAADIAWAEGLFRKRKKAAKRRVG